MNLLDTLLGFARVEEDPVTEILAWFLDASPAIRDEVLALFPTRVAVPRAPDGSFTPPAITTQVVDGNGSCRYDLVLDWHAPRRRLVLEVKVWADLTFTAATDPDTEQATAVDQITRYLTLARESDVETHVVLLAPYAVELPNGAALDEAFAGQLSWQTVHDAIARVAASDALDPTMRTLARDFVHALEIRRMAAPKLTFDALTSVYRYRRFERSITTMLTHARDALLADGTLAGFHKGNKTAWQDAHDRLGWRVWLDPSRDDAFAFLGIHVGEGTIHEEVPDLYFFLETRRGSAAQKALDAEKAAIADALATPAPNAATRWSFHEGGWEAIRARTSLVEIAREEDPTDAATRWFRACVLSLKANGVLQRYLDAHAAK